MIELTILDYLLPTKLSSEFIIMSYMGKLVSAGKIVSKCNAIVPVHDYVKFYCHLIGGWLAHATSPIFIQIIL